MKQIETVAATLLMGKKVTSMTMFDLGITRLAALIKQLRDMGFKVDTQLKHNGRTHYAVYSCDTDTEMAEKIKKGEMRLTRGRVLSKK